MQYGVVLTVFCGCVVAQIHSQRLHPTHNGTLDRLQNSSSAGEPRLGVVTNSYYDFLINEGSYKFWAVFQLVTVAILLYSTFAAIYYAKYTFLKEVENSEVSESDFLLRSSRSLRGRPFLGLHPATFQRIIDSVASLHDR
ncbi:uncharacterized protein LOC128989380 [Macrosteles quadrilineatus]|uniref:uncharacterized protein LOC128989380 n=1 Tax=Macrosteles quadrilineatus TaxID=74068 RepID=UPI0023E129B9|nr:uncharacterized protein LOC128989380 [Macrosteles quadrilineatus]